MAIHVIENNDTKSSKYGFHPMNEPLGSRFEEDWYPGRESNP
jgi:hypothetical protein